MEKKRREKKRKRKTQKIFQKEISNGIEKESKLKSIVLKLLKFYYLKMCYSISFIVKKMFLRKREKFLFENNYIYIVFE